MRNQPPLIGVTGPDNRHALSWLFIGLGIRMAGGRMVRITPSRPRYDTRLAGLVVSGGTDVDPKRYGQPRKAGYGYDLPRDALEMRWIERALRESLPLFGICRGMQLLNVCLGGTLYRDIKLVCETARYPGGLLSKIIYRKPVVLKEDSFLAGLLQSEVLAVNSLHRQSLDAIGAGLKVTAWESNGIVQAVEGMRSGHFVLGVQWHPEFMPHAKLQRRIFRAFVRACIQPT